MWLLVIITIIDMEPKPTTGLMSMSICFGGSDITTKLKLSALS